MNQHELIPKKVRLKRIFEIVNKRPPCSNRTDMLKLIRYVFRKVETAAELYHMGHNIADFVDKQTEKMVCLSDMRLSGDFSGHQYVEYKKHILIVSRQGAFAVYTINELLLGDTAEYEEKKPLYCKLSKCGVDVFGRKEAVF